MNYEKQVDIIEAYIRSGEKKEEDFKLGAEFEHFVIDLDTYETVSYYGEKGIETILKELAEEAGFTPNYEGDHLLSLSRGPESITLEPGAQLEYSTDAYLNIKDIEKDYLKFLSELLKILNKHNYGLIALGYHPKTKIDQIKLLPKKRYDLMFDYLKDKGRFAHNMMKGTGAFQITMDFSSEEDYRKKQRLANALTPILCALFDNSYYFEGDIWEKENLRTAIWNEMDDSRSKVVPGSLDSEFSYRAYGEYIVNSQPIFTIRDGETIATGNKTVSEILDTETIKEDEIEHLMTMVFPDVRTKRYLEIRVMDAIPYPYNLSCLAFLKGLIYDKKNLDELGQVFSGFSEKDIYEARLSIIENGLKGLYKGRTILDWAGELFEKAEEGLTRLNEDELGYLYPLETIIKNERSLRDVTEILAERRGFKDSLRDNLLNNIEGEDDEF